jgi:DNA polymerase-3 subunit delta
MAKRYPMMSEYQVVIVKEAQNIRHMEPIEAYLQKPLTSTILVFCHKNGALDRRKRLVGVIDKVGVLYESKKLKERDLPAFIENYLREKGVGIDDKSNQLIAESIGSDLNRLTSELDKLIISLPENDRRVTPQIVEDQIGASKDFNGFELRDAIVYKNVFKANQIIDYFDKNPKAGSIYAFLPLLFNYFENLMIAFYCPKRNDPNEVARYLDMKSSWAVQQYMTGMRNYTGMKTLQIIRKIREIDAKSKGLDNPNTPPGELMKELVFFILH